MLICLCAEADGREDGGRHQQLYVGAAHIHDGGSSADADHRESDGDHPIEHTTLLESFVIQAALAVLKLLEQAKGYLMRSKKLSEE